MILTVLVASQLYLTQTPEQRQYGGDNTPLGKAVTLCHKHSNTWNGGIHGAPPYKSPWNDCYTIDKKWQDHLTKEFEKNRSKITEEQRIQDEKDWLVIHKEFSK